MKNKTRNQFYYRNDLLRAAKGKRAVAVIAADCNLAPGTVTRALEGHPGVNITTLWILAGYFGIDWTAFFDLEGRPIGTATVSIRQLGRVTFDVCERETRHNGQDPQMSYFSNAAAVIFPANTEKPIVGGLLAVVEHEGVLNKFNLDMTVDRGDVLMLPAGFLAWNPLPNWTF